MALYCPLASVCTSIVSLLLCTALLGLFGCLLLSIVGCIVSFKAIYLPSVALSFRLGTFIRLGLFRAVEGQKKSILLSLSGLYVRGLLLYIKFLLLTILLGTTKSCSVVRFAVCPSEAGFLRQGQNSKKSLNLAVWLYLLLFGFLSCRISLVSCRLSCFLPYFFCIAVFL